MRQGIRRRSGFSLAELLVVMVIIAMLSGMAVVTTRGYLIRGKKSTAKAEIASFVNAIDSFYAEQSRYPTNAEGLSVLLVPTESFPDGFMKKVPLDPWKHPYVYRTPGAKGPFDVISYGADGKEGGINEAADIRSE